jgi:hypothetical protein
VAERDGRATLELQDLTSGRPVPLRHFRGHTPHSSPSLSWNGRYVAAIVQLGPRRQAVIEDRATGSLQRLPLPGGAEPLGLSLAPDARTLVVALPEGGRQRLRLLDLTGLLEPDLAPGQALRGGGPP